MASHRSFQLSVSQILSHISPAFTLIYTELHKKQWSMWCPETVGVFAVSYKYTVYSEANRSWRKHCYYILITRSLLENQQLLMAFSCMQSRPTLKKKCHSTDIYSSITKTLNTFQKISGRVIFGSLVLQIPYRDEIIFQCFLHSLAKLLLSLTKLVMEIMR